MINFSLKPWCLSFGVKNDIIKYWEKFIPLPSSSNIKELTIGVERGRWTIWTPYSVTELQLESQLRDQPRMWTKETFSEERKGFWWKSHRKKEKTVWEIKQEDGCEGLVGFTKRVDAPTLFALILCFLISILPFQSALVPTPEPLIKESFVYFWCLWERRVPGETLLMNPRWKHFLGSEKGLRGRCTWMIIWPEVLWGHVGCFSHIW